MIIDAHQHFWKLDSPFDYRWLDESKHLPIRRDQLPDDLRPLLDHAGIDQTILVQTQHDLDENRWALGLADHHPWIAGIVGWIDLASDSCEEQLLEFKSHPKFVGVRHITQDEPDDDFILHPNVVRGLKILERHQVPFDLLFFTKHLKHAATLARELPGLPLVIDHLAKPKIGSRELIPWANELEAAAQFPNVFCKLSGMVTEANWNDWTVAELRPYVEVALEAFGPERCLFGSDWPVCELAGSYEQVHSAIRETLSSLSIDEQAQIFGETATRFYGLPNSKNTPHTLPREGRA